MIEVTQRHADVRVDVLAPDGQLLTAFDTPDQDTGVERLRVVTQAAGTCSVRVTPTRPGGGYDITLVEVRRATPLDHRVMQAQRAYMQAEALRKQGTEASQRASLALYQQSIAGFAEGGEVRAHGVALNSRAIVLSVLGDVPGSIRDLEESLRLRRAARDRAGEAQTLANLGIQLERAGRLREALAHYTVSLETRRQIGDRWGVANALTRLGMLYSSLDDLARADRLLAQAQAMWRELGDEKWELISIVERARLQIALGHPRAAIDLYKRTAALHPSGRGRLALASALIDLGWCALSAGDTRDARDLFSRALDLATLTGSVDAQSRARMGEAFAWMREAQERSGAARTDALRVARTSGMQAWMLARTLGRQDEADALSILMQIFTARGERNAAIIAGTMAVDAYTQIGRDLSGVAPRLQQQYVQARGDTFRRLARLLIDEGRLLEAEHVLVMLKAEEYTRFLRGGGHASPALSSASRPDITRCIALADRAATLARTCEDMRTRGFRSPEEKKQYLSLRDELAAANEAVLRFFDEQRGASKNAADITDLEKSTSAIMSDLGELGPDVVALYPLVLDDSVSIIMVTPQARIARRYQPPPGKPFRRADLRAQVAGLREALQNPSLDPRPRARALYDIIVGPVAEDLRRYHAKTIMWFVDGELRYVPMGALFDGHHYLVESYRMETATLASLPRLKDVPRPRWRGLGLGVSRAHAVTVDGGERDDFPALPFVRDELRIIGESAQARDGALFDGRVLLDEGFTADALREALLPDAEGGFSLVHIASHFQFLPGDVSRSYLLLGDGRPLPLSWFNRRGEQIFRGVDLLTLSACNTATGAMSADGVEMEGFAELAQQQGARAVLATLWPVADASTAQLMKELYRLRQAPPGMSKAEALRQAQLALLEGRIRPTGSGTQRAEAHYTPRAKPARDAQTPPWRPDPSRPFAHPFYWAPFVLFGNWQ